MDGEGWPSGRLYLGFQEWDNRLMEPQSITVALADESQGYAIAPGRVPLSVLAEFASDVQALIRGSQKEVDTRELEVSVEKGSLQIVTAPMFAPVLFAELQSLLSSPDLSALDPKRRNVFIGWQTAAKASLSRVVRIASSAFDRALVVDRTTDFRSIDSETWVDVERYVHGELLDLGGATKSNAHIKLPDGTKLIVKTDKEMIRAETDNRVYHSVHLRIRAKYNIHTGELRDASLISFVDYSPSFDEAAFERLTAKGRQAWADVDDPASWVRGLRGSDE